MPDRTEQIGGVIVYAEASMNSISQTTMELLGLGATLSEDLGEALTSIIIGHGVIGLAENLIKHGSHAVYVADDSSLGWYDAGPYASLLEEVCKRRNPKLLLLAHTQIGRDLAARTSFRLRAPLAAGCDGLSFDKASQRFSTLGQLTAAR